MPHRISAKVRKAASQLASKGTTKKVKKQAAKVLIDHKLKEH